MGQAGRELDQDERALLELLPADGSEAASEGTLGRLGWDAGRYARACVRLEERGYVQSGQGRAETVHRDLTAVPPEFRPACGRPGSRVVVRQVPVTVPHALCDLTDVLLSYPGHGGAVVPQPGHSVGNSLGCQVAVDALTLDVTVRVSGLRGNA
jgi:hypothetical protein